MSEPSNIHPTAIVHPQAEIGTGVTIGPYAVIGEEVRIGPGVRVGPHAVIEFADIGANTVIHASAFLGTAPQDLKYRGERTKLVIGSGCIVRECATLNRGTAASGATRIGDRCLFMANSHVAHDCIVGDEVILANSVAVAGHCEIGDGSVIGGMAGIHQFVRVGRLAMVGAGAMVPLDIPPFTMAQGDRARLSGLNVVGIRRRGLDTEDISALKRTYFDVFDSDRPIKERVEELRKEDRGPLAKEFLEFLGASPRGITRPGRRAEDSSEHA